MKDIDNQEATAAYLDVPERTLEDWRYRGVGPRYLKLSGRHIKYRKSDVDEWLRTRAVEPEPAAS